MSYEPDLQIKKLCALENSRSKTMVLQAREGLPVDEGGVMTNKALQGAGA